MRTTSSMGRFSNRGNQDYTQTMLLSHFTSKHKASQYEKRWDDYLTCKWFEALESKRVGKKLCAGDLHAIPRVGSGFKLLDHGWLNGDQKLMEQILSKSSTVFRGLRKLWSCVILHLPVEAIIQPWGAGAKIGLTISSEATGNYCRRKHSWCPITNSHMIIVPCWHKDVHVWNIYNGREKAESRHGRLKAFTSKLEADTPQDLFLFGVIYWRYLREDVAHLCEALLRDTSNLSPFTNKYSVKMYFILFWACNKRVVRPKPL